MSVPDSLEQPCAQCQRPIGDHLVREMVTCGLKPAVDLAYEDTPSDISHLATQFGFPAGTLVADHITAKALVIDTAIGPFPVLLHEFMVGRPGMPPIDVVQVAYLGGDTMRPYGRLIRDTANGAANAADKRRAA